MLKILVLILAGFAIAEIVSQSAILSAIVVLLGLATLFVSAIKLANKVTK